MGRPGILERERRWARPTAYAAFAAVLFTIASIVVASSVFGGTDGASELLRKVDEHPSDQIVASIFQGIGAGLLAIPLLYLFRAAEARSDRMRGQLVGVAVAAPLFLLVASVLTGFGSVDAAHEFVTKEVPRLMAKGVGLSSDRANEVATDASTGASLRPLGVGFEIGGRIGFAVAMFYSALYSMRTGLLPRFWGSLGMALGAVSFIPAFAQFAVLWYLYFGLLAAGWVPGGRPPAWAAGEAIPWPSPGEKASAELEGGEPDGTGGKPDEDDGEEGDGESRSG